MFKNKKINKKEREFIQNTLKNKFKNFSKEYLDFNLNENNKELWIKNNINFSNYIKSLDLMKKLYVNTDYKFMNWNQI